VKKKKGNHPEPKLNEQDNIMVNVASASECTGMLHKPPKTDAELEGYTAIYHGPNSNDNPQKSSKKR